MPDVIYLAREAVEQAIERPFSEWAKDCHGVSLKILKAGLVPGGRIARGTCLGVRGQHSWIVNGRDCYNRTTQIIDPTLWSYRDDVDGIWYGTLGHGWHRPHGTGTIWDYGKPIHQGGETIEVDTSKLSRRARDLLELILPLDRRGWDMLLHAPVQEWPAGEIHALAQEYESLAVIAPVDLVGMTTDLNPDGMYW